MSIAANPAVNSEIRRSVLLLQGVGASGRVDGLEGFAVTAMSHRIGMALPEGRFHAIVAIIPDDATEARQYVGALIAQSGGLPVLTLGTLPQEDTAIDLIRLGAEDYLLRSGVPGHAVARIINYAVERRNSARREAEVELYLSGVLAAVRSPLAITDADDRLLIVNPGWTDAFGWAAAACEGKPMAEFLTETGTTTGTLASIRHRDGGTRLAQSRAVEITVRLRQRKVWSLDPVDADIVDPPLARRPRVSSERVQIIPLDAVRQELGARWARLAARVYAIAERIIRGRLGKGDVFGRTEAGDFTVCFAELDEAAARYKAQAIENEIRATLIGGDLDAPQVEVVPPQVETVAQPDAEKPETAAMTALRLLREIDDDASLRLRNVAVTTGGSADFVLADFDSDACDKIRELAALVPAAELRGRLDVIAVEKVAALLSSGARKGTVCVAIGFGTLLQRPQRDRLLAVMRGLPEAVRQSLAIRVQDIPTAMLPARIADLIGMLRPFCRLRLADLDMPVLNFSPRDAGVGVVCLTETALRRDMRALAAFSQQVRIGGARLAIDGVSLRSTLEASRRVGADYLAFAGRQIEPATAPVRRLAAG